MNLNCLPAEYQRFPKKWKILSFNEAFKDLTGGQAKIKNNDYLNDGYLPIADQGKSLFGGFTNNCELACNIELPCILFGDHTKIFKFIEKPFALGADGVKVLKQRSDIDPKFAYYYLNTLTLPNVGYSRHFRFLKRTFFPLPPIAEQKRIATILDKADTIRKKRQEAIKLTEELLRSQFLEMFGDPVTNPKGWEICQIRDITDVKTGKTPSRKDPTNYGGTIRWVKTTEVTNNIIQDTEEYLTEKGVTQMSIFPKNSIIVAMYGQGVTRGRTAILGVPCTTNQACAVILPNQRYRPIYLWTLLRFSYQRLRELGRGGNQPNLNLDMIKNFSIILPSLKQQDLFVNFENKIHSYNIHSENMKIESDNLFNSLLQKAFKGEL